MLEEIKNLTQDDVLELINDFPIQPTKSRVVITANTEELDDDEVELTGSAFSPIQYVLAVGSYTKEWLKPGQKIHLNLDAMTVNIPSEDNAYQNVQSIQLKPVEIAGKIFVIITEDKIDYLINS